jgi:hypothetical protein
MISGARYARMNLIANDWRPLARFHEKRFGCTPFALNALQGSGPRARHGIPGA